MRPDILPRHAHHSRCSNGHHTASSDGPLGVVVWGLDSYSSYAYPAGGSTRTLSDVVVPPG